MGCCNGAPISVFRATNLMYKITGAGFDAAGNAFLSGYYEDRMLIHDAAGQ